MTKTGEAAAGVISDIEEETSRDAGYDVIEIFGIFCGRMLESKKKFEP